MQPNEAFKKQAEINANYDEENAVEREFILSFSINESRFGISFDRVHEVVDFFEPTPYPFSVSGHIGVINLRGNVVPIIDPYQHDFSEEPSCHLKFVIFKSTNENLVGMVVNKVRKIEVESEKIKNVTEQVMLNIEEAPLRYITIDYLLTDYEEKLDESA